MASEMAASAATAVAPDRLDQPRHGKRGAPQAFARKLAEILRDEAESVISWNDAGTAFMVKDVERFSQDVLVKHYRHSKFSSFQRQLNLYQFRKIVKGPDAGGYQHPMFHRDRPEDLCHVRRSVSGSGGAGAKASAKRNGAATAAVSASKQQAAKLGDGGAGWAPPRAHKSAAAARRVGKLRNKAVVPAAAAAAAARDSRNPSSNSSNIMMSPQQQQQHSPSFAQLVLMADHHHNQQQQQQQQQVAVGPTTRGQTFSAAAATEIASDAGERSPWTSGESSDSDASIADAAATTRGGGAERSATTRGAGKKANHKEPRGLQQHQRGRGLADSSDNDGDAEGGSSTDGDDEARGAAGRREELVQRQLQEAGGRDAAGLSSRDQQKGGEGAQLQGVGAGAGGGGGGQRGSGSAATKKSPFSFFKKFSFDRQSSSLGRDKSTSSADSGDAGAPAPASAPSDRPMSSTSSSSSNLGNVPVSPLMVDTSAAARAAAAGLGVTARGVRPPPVTVTGGGGGHRVIDPSTAAGNKALLSSPLTPKSSMEAAALAAAARAAAAMPPPPKREQREELGLVEQLTNMVEVFDICDLLRKVSTSNSSRLDKHGGIVKPSGPQHLRNMSVDTDQGLPHSPGGGGGRQGQSPTGLGSLASMELVRDSSKDWDTLMAGSADVSDLGNTMVQSVAEFFSF